MCQKKYFRFHRNAIYVYMRSRDTKQNGLSRGEGGGAGRGGGGCTWWIFDSMLGLGKNFRPYVQTILLEKCTHCPGRGSRWIFDVMLGSGTNLRPNVQTFLPEKCTHFTEMYRKFPPKNAPILMKCTENLAQNSTHLYAICRTNFIQRYTSFHKIYRMLSGKNSTHYDQMYR